MITKHFQESFATLPSATLSLILIGAGVVYILIGIFSHNLLVKAGAAAYAVLP